MSKELKVGAFAILAVIVFVFGFKFLKNEKIGLENRYYAIYKSVDGLNGSSEIFINGVPIGKVQSIKFLDPSKDLSKIIVAFTVDKDIKLPKKSVATIQSGDFLSGPSISIMLSSEQDFYNSEDTLLTSIKASMMGSLEQKITPLSNNANELLHNLNGLFGDRGDQSINEVVVNINRTLKKIGGTTSKITMLVDAQSNTLTQTLNNIHSITQNIEQSNADITQLISNLNTVSGQLKEIQFNQTVQNIDKAISGLNQAIDKVNKGDGTISKLLNTPTIHQDIDKLLKDLDALVLDVKAHPKKYVSLSLIERREKKPKENKKRRRRLQNDKN